MSEVFEGRMLLALKMEEEVMSQDSRCPEKRDKVRQGNLQERLSCAQESSPEFGLVRADSDSHLQNGKMINMGGFKPLRFCFVTVEKDIESALPVSFLHVFLYDVVTVKWVFCLQVLGEWESSRWL